MAKRIGQRTHRHAQLSKQQHFERFPQLNKNANISYASVIRYIRLERLMGWCVSAAQFVVVLRFFLFTFASIDQANMIVYYVCCLGLYALSDTKSFR